MEGRCCPLTEYGYSRDHCSDQIQVRRTVRQWQKKCSKVIASPLLRQNRCP
jgi:hypothetical protein